MDISSSDLIYKQKYLKYKRKYIQLKKNNNLSGGWGEGEIIICYNKKAMEYELSELRKDNDKYKNPNLDQKEGCDKRDLKIDWSDTKKLFSNFEGVKIYQKNKKKLIPRVSLGMLKRIINSNFLLKCFSIIPAMKDETKFILDIKTKDAEIKKDPSKNTGFIIKSPYEKKEIKLDPLKEGETYLQKIILDKYPKPEDISEKIDTINNLVTNCNKSNYETLLTKLNCFDCDSVMHLQFNKITKNKIIYNNLVKQNPENIEVIKFDASNKEAIKSVINNNMSDATSFMSVEENVEKKENEKPGEEESSITGGSDSSETQEGGKPIFLIIFILIAVWVMAKIALSILRQIIKLIFKTAKQYKEIKNS